MDTVKSSIKRRGMASNSDVRADGSLRILGLCPHPVKDLIATTGFGGVSSHFFRSLAQRHEVTLGETCLKSFMHYVNRLRSLVVQPHAWRQYAGKNPWVFRARSRIAHRLVKQLKGEIDLVIQRQGLNAPFIGQPLKPYAIYTDYTTKLGDTHSHLAYRNSFHRNSRERETYYHLEGEAYRKASRVFTYNELVCRSMIEDYGVDPERVITYAGMSNPTPFCNFILSGVVPRKSKNMPAEERKELLDVIKEKIRDLDFQRSLMEELGMTEVRYGMTSDEIEKGKDMVLNRVSDELERLASIL